MVTEKFSRLEFCNSVTVANISAAYDTICSAFQAEADVEIDIAELSEADLTFVQLLESARRSAAEDGRALRLRQPAHGSLLRVLQRGGFLESEDRERSDFWLNGESAQ